MRKLSLVCFLSLCFISSYAWSNVATSGVHEPYPYTFSISKHVYQFSEVYQIDSQQKETYPGSIKKSAFRVRTNYDLSNADGWQATGITRLVSLGSLYLWAKDIDIYDTRGKQIALIDGNFATLDAAKFNLYEYDDAGNTVEVGLAYASLDFNHFAILSSANDPRPIVELNRNFGDQTWTVSVHNPEKIDDRLVRIFSGFVIDNQDKFLADVKS